MINLHVKILATVLTLPLLAGCRPNTIPGNGQTVTREFPVEDFSEISLEGIRLTGEYVRQTGKPGLTLTLDENLFDRLNVEVVGRKLIIAPKNKQKQLGPTRFYVRARSTNLSKLEKAGSGEFTISTPLAGDELNIRLAGKNTVRLPHRAAVKILDIQLSGMNTLEADSLGCDWLKADAAGRNTFRLGGNIRAGSFNLGGSNRIQAAPCRFASLNCKSAGSGTIKAHVTDRIDLRSAGKVHLCYRGNPTISRRTAGVCTVVQTD